MISFPIWSYVSLYFRSSHNVRIVESMLDKDMSATRYLTKRRDLFSFCLLTVWV